MSAGNGGPTVPPTTSSTVEAPAAPASPTPAGHTHAFYPPPALDPAAIPTTSPPCFACGKPPLIYQRLAAVTRTVRAVAKKGYNSEHDYHFRSIDDFYNALSPALGEHEVVVQPNIISRERAEIGKTRGGAGIIRLQTRTRFRLFTVDGSFMEVDVDSESIDYGGDKAPFKAASGAYKYMVMQVFAVRVEAEETPESERDDGRPDRARGAPPSKWKGKAAPRENENPDDQGLEAGPELKPLEARMRVRLRELKSLVEFEAWAADWRSLPEPVKAALREDGKKRKLELTDAGDKAAADAAGKAAEGPTVPVRPTETESLRKLLDDDHAQKPLPSTPAPESRPVVTPSPASSSEPGPCWELGPDGSQCQLGSGHGGPHKDGERTWSQAKKKGGK